MVRKGQFFLAGMLLLGLSLLSLGFTTFEFTSLDTGEYTYQNVEETIPVAAERYSKMRGNSFMEAFHFFSINHRQNADLGGNSLEMTVVAGFQEGQDMEVYTGNFHGSPQEVNVEVNGESIYNSLSGDSIVSNTTAVSDSYSVNVVGEHFNRSFTSSGSEFLLVAYRHSTSSAVRQDTYTS